jgi:hypothetical protein
MKGREKGERDRAGRGFAGQAKNIKAVPKVFIDHFSA